MQSDINTISNRMSNKKLKLNVRKCQLQIFGKKRLLQRTIVYLPNIYLNGSVVPKSKLCKYLGVVITENLNMNNHLNSLMNKVCSKAVMLARCRFYVTEKSAKQMVKTHIISLNEHGLIFYNMADNYTKKKLQSCINISFQYACRDQGRISNNDLYSFVGILPMMVRSDLASIKLLYLYKDDA